jgi:hypothetical protein
MEILFSKNVAVDFLSGFLRNTLFSFSVIHLTTALRVSEKKLRER